MFIYIYIYIYIEREREDDTESHRNTQTLIYSLKHQQHENTSQRFETFQKPKSISLKTK